MIKKQDLPNVNLNELPDGSNVVYGTDNKPEAIIMSIKYYSKLQLLLEKVKKLLGDREK